MENQEITTDNQEACINNEYEIKIKGVYRHYCGNLYIVEDLGLDSETLETMVIYRALYGDNKTWIRPATMFVEEVEGKDQKHRFELQHFEDNRAKKISDLSQ